MTRERFRAAFTAWRLAIEEKCRHDDETVSYLDLAKQYGKTITNHADLEEVGECFNWDMIMDYIEGDK